MISLAIFRMRANNKKKHQLLSESITKRTESDFIFNLLPFFLLVVVAISLYL